MTAEAIAKLRTLEDLSEELIDIIEKHLGEVNYLAVEGRIKNSNDFDWLLQPLSEALHDARSALAKLDEISMRELDGATGTVAKAWRSLHLTLDAARLELALAEKDSEQEAELEHSAKKKTDKAVLFNFVSENSEMGKPLSEDLRKRIYAKRQEGHTTAEVSGMFGVSIRTVDRYSARMRTQGNLSHDKLGKPPGSCLDAHREEISKWIGKEPGLTLEEIAARCKEQWNLSVHHTTVMRALGKWGFRYKKNDIRQRAEPS